MNRVTLCLRLEPKVVMAGLDRILLKHQTPSSKSEYHMLRNSNTASNIKISNSVEGPVSEDNNGNLTRHGDPDASSAP